jgi:lipopolysaccharide transport system permease protein
MYATPVIYSSTYPKNELVRRLVGLNPLSSIFEASRLGLLGSGSFEWSSLLYSSAIILLLTFIGVVVFNKIQSNFIDTV